MIIYKLEDISNRIEEMRNNINSVLDKGEAYLNSDVEKYRSKKQEIINSNTYTETGKAELVNELSKKHYDGIKESGENFINEIAKEYDSAIARVNTLMQYASEAKAVHEDKGDKVKENTNLMYAVQVLNSIDEVQETGMLKDLFEKYKNNEKIINLIKLKANNLSKNGVTSQDLEEVIKDIKLLDTDYIEQLKAEKDRRINYFSEIEYPCKAFARDLSQIYEFKVGKSLLDFAQ